MSNGYFISFEGVDGSGKSTQISKLKEYLEESGYDVILSREPGGTRIGEQIRSVILDPANREMTAVTEALLYAASRAQHVHDVIAPAVKEGQIVICDRFVDSSIAYQQYGRKLGECVRIINGYAIDGCMPDLTFLLKVKPDVGGTRIGSREKDRIELEDKSFHEAVYQGYESLQEEFSERIVGIDAARSVDEIFAEITDADLLLLEANHEKEILLMGHYPYHLKRRILGDHGHLSNVSAGECLCRLIEENRKPRQVLLGHLSRENNDPSVAMLTVTNTLQEQDIFPGDDLTVEVMLRDACSCLYEV